MAEKKKNDIALGAAPQTGAYHNSQTAADVPETKKSWGEQLNGIMTKIESRQPFNYDLNGDALYNQYKDRFVQQGKMAMMDTMGQAQAMTGGYGNTYAQGAGQQAYQGYLQGLNDIVPDLYNMAYQKYADEGAQLYQQAGLYADMDDRDYQRGQVELDRQLESRNNLMSFISATGMMPTDEDLAKAGLSKAEAEALRNTFISSNPDIAYRNGEIDGEQYKALTGVYPAGYTPAGGGGGGYEYYGPDDDDNEPPENAKIGNMNGNGWIYVDGEGRISYPELEAKVNSGSVKEVYDRKTNTITYK